MGAQRPHGELGFPDEAVNGSLGDRFLDVAARYPERVALRSPAGTWTYEALADDVLRLGHRLRSAAAPEGSSVAILADHDGPLVLAMLACAVAGRVFVVLDPTAPDTEVEHIVTSARSHIALHDAEHEPRARAVIGAATDSGALVSLDEREGPPLDPLPAVSAADPLMLAFTSGTTGDSKGAVIPHGLLLNVIRGATRALGIGPDDTLPMLFPASLAVAAYPAFLPLLNGGCLATLDLRSVGLAPLADFLRDEHISVAYLAPTIVRFLVDGLAGRSFPDLRILALGGELVDAEVVALTVDSFGARYIANGFGATETGVIALYVFDPADAPSGPIPSGKPVPDIELSIVDDEGGEVPEGTSGEILVRSPYLFAGYLGHDELSAQVLEPDPHGREGWASYRTGDLGRLEPDGSLVVLGRLDSTVKVRGRFVVLGDVERDISDVESVADATVAAITEGGVTELGAMVVTAEADDLSPSQLRAHLLDSHEAYRVPTRWLFVDALPQLPNGKVDRRAVAAALADPSSLAGEPDAASASGGDAAGRIHRELRDLWELLLPVETVGPDDDFMHLGGHSLLAAQMLVMAEQRLDITIPMSELVHARTLRQLTDVAVRIEARHDSDPSTVACVQQGDANRPRLWFLHDLPGSAYRVRHLAAELGPTQPVWSFESPLLRGEPNTFGDLDGFVARYLADLRAEQPEGPYWLAGYSFGGPCAYEMATQLRAQGEEVALLAIIDTGPGYRGPNWSGRHSPPWPYFGVPMPPPEGSTATEVARHYADMVKRSPLAAARHLTLRTGAARRIDAVRFASDLRRHGRVRPEWRLWYAWEEHWALATKAWDRTKPYDGRLDLLWASLTGSTDGSMGWDPLVSDLRIHRFEGFHDHLLEEAGAPAVAAVLREIIDELSDGGADGEPPETKDTP